MANNCIYSMRVAAQDKKSINRLLKIMKYKDKQFYMYRVFDAEFADIDNKKKEVHILKDGDLYWAQINGSVAWSCGGWLDTTPYEGKSKTGASYSHLYELCDKLNIGVEIWSEEPGQCFQEHFMIDHNGNEYLETADGYDWDDPDNTGFAGDYMNWCDTCDIYELPTGMVLEFKAAKEKSKNGKSNKES